MKNPYQQERRARPAARRRRVYNAARRPEAGPLVQLLDDEALSGVTGAANAAAETASFGGRFHTSAACGAAVERRLRLPATVTPATMRHADPPSPAPTGGGALGPLPEALARSGLAFALVDEDGRLAAVNAAFAEVAGATPGAILGMPLDELLAGALVDPQELAATLAGRRRRTVVEGPFRRRDGSAFWGSVTLTPGGSDARRPLALALLDDASERRRLDEEQRSLRDLLGAAASEWRATFDAIEMPILILGVGGRVERLNRAARDLAGQEFRDILGRRLGEIGDQALWREAEGLVEGVGREHQPATAQVQDEAAGRTWLLAASPGLPDLSKARPVILTVRELTGLVRLQESLRRSETMAAMGTLVAGVAHEVRNPLFGISAVIDALERRVDEREELSSHLGFLRREVRRLEKLMADLLDFGRPVVPEPEPMRLDRVVEDALLACSAQIEQATVTVEHRAAEAPPPVLLDRRRVTQALVNLVENALHHAPAGSRVEIVTEVVERAGHAWSQVTVRDHGPGFRESDLGRLFEPFFSRREGGTGLGLPIVLKIVEGHGGVVEADNAEDGGAVVRLRFPVHEQPNAAERRTP